MLKRIVALAIAGALSLGAAHGQGTNPGSSPLSIAKGGTAAATASAARTSLGLAIGTNVQAFDADLAALAGLTTAADKCQYWTGAAAAALIDCKSWVRSFIAAADASAGRTSIGLAIGTDVQAFDADLAAIAGLTSANNKCFYWTGSGTAANYDCTSFGRSVANTADAAALRTLGGLVIGTNVQAFDADLAALAGLTSAADKCFYWTGSGAAATFDCLAWARAFISAADAAAGRTSLGLGTSAVVATGTSGATIPLNNGGFTQSGSVNFTSTFQINGNTQTFPAAAATLTRTVASGAKALATGAISSAACTTAQTDTATGTLTTDTIIPTFNGDPTAVTGYIPLTTGMLTIVYWPTADTVNFKVCNLTSSGITPGAITLNWKVVR